MRRKDAVFVPTPPSLTAQNNIPQPEQATASGVQTTPSPSSENLNSSIIITVLVIAAAIIVSASFFLLFRCVHLHSRRRRHSSSVQIDALSSDSFPRHHHSRNTSQVAPGSSSVIDSLPLFTFASITGFHADNSRGDCAVCLSKFEPQDQLRLLPVCCHTFHAECIDTWLAKNETCPLCRSAIFLSESEVMRKILSTTVAPISPRSRSDSFRVEIGSVSRRYLPSESGSSHRRSYSIGSFDYIVDDTMSEVSVASTRRRPESAGNGDKRGRRSNESDMYVAAPPGETLAAEVAGGGERWRNSWLKDYVDRMPFSLSSSFRSSGRFFCGSSRRTDESRVVEADLEATPLGDEISEMFRWLSGV